VLAGGPTRGDPQAHLALAHVAEQPPSSTPTSLLVRMTSESERNADGRRPIPIGAAEVGSASQLSVLLRLRRSRFRFPIGRATVGRADHCYQVVLSISDGGDVQLSCLTRAAQQCRGRDATPAGKTPRSCGKGEWCGIRGAGREMVLR
jgi:hypothetical protein